MAGPIKRVMIVDDHDAVRRGIRALVETRANFTVVGEASSGRDAVEVAKTCSPHIAIVDYSLPGLNGIAVTTALKRDIPGIEVAIYTMHDKETVIVEALRAGARAFVMKSDSEEYLLAALDALALRRPYFSGIVSEALLQQFLRASRPETESLLTDREREIVQLIAEGQSNKEVAGTLSISVKTVETHRASAMRKLKLRSTADLVRYAIRNNLIEP